MRFPNGETKLLPDMSVPLDMEVVNVQEDAAL
jgi:hypothetical protein